MDKMTFMAWKDLWVHCISTIYECFFIWIMFPNNKSIHTKKTLFWEVYFLQGCNTKLSRSHFLLQKYCDSELKLCIIHRYIAYSMCKRSYTEDEWIVHITNKLRWILDAIEKWKILVGMSETTHHMWPFTTKGISCLFFLNMRFLAYLSLRGKLNKLYNLPNL